jgi:hypothetical protein
VLCKSRGFIFLAKDMEKRKRDEEKGTISFF